MHVCVLIDERWILSLFLGEPGFPLPSAVIWAQDINHFPTVKDKEVFLGSAIAGFHQSSTLPFALLLDLAHCIFTPGRTTYVLVDATAFSRMTSGRLVKLASSLTPFHVVTVSVTFSERQPGFQQPHPENFVYITV